MTVRRLALTAGAMAVIAAALRALAPSPVATLGALTAPQHLADTAGPGVLVVALVGDLAWLIWAWGALGLLLTAAGALPGVTGRAAGLLLRALLPAAARRAAAVALGVGMVLNGPLLAGAALASPAGPVSAPTVALSVPDWPAGPTAAIGAGQPSVPDWPPDAPATGDHLVVRGDCLWDIAAAHLVATTGRRPTDGEVAAAAHAWWSANARVIGPDPDLLLPGQVLRPPGLP